MTQHWITCHLECACKSQFTLWLSSVSIFTSSSIRKLKEKLKKNNFPNFLNQFFFLFKFFSRDGSGETEKWLKRLNDPTTTGFGRTSPLPVMFNVRKSDCGMETDEKRRERKWFSDALSHALHARDRRFSKMSIREGNRGNFVCDHEKLPLHGKIIFKSFRSNFDLGASSVLSHVDAWLMWNSFINHPAKTKAISSIIPTLKFIMWFCILRGIAENFSFLHKTCVLPQPTTTVKHRHVQHV